MTLIICGMRISKGDLCIYFRETNKVVDSILSKLALDENLPISYQVFFFLESGGASVSINVAISSLHLFQ